ncbi:MAG: hypothetical protein LBC85_02245 [Fibromonadaceae bacterium]|nr:hypothetical protein [Fibromonadaceae bacterium]
MWFIFLAILFLGTAYAEAEADTTKSIDGIPPFDADYFLLRALQRTGDTTPQSAQLDTVSSIIERERQQKRDRHRQNLEKMSYEDLFRAAFKTEKTRAQYFMVRFVGDGKSFGTTEISYDSAFTAFTFYSIAFSQYLDSILIPDERPKVNGDDGLFDSEQLKNLGFEISLNELMHELRIDLPPEMKVLQRMSFSRTRELRGSQIKPAFFSFYANLHARESFGCINYVETDCNRGALFLDSDGALALGGFVLESRASFREPQNGQTLKENLRRGDIRLVKDIYSLNSRLTLGDVGGVSNLMVYEPMAGIRYEHNERIFARNRLVERHRINFYLPRASNVEVHIDGKLNRRLFLPSGFHEISGLTGHTGLNTVQVFIPGEDGLLREVRYEFELGDARTLLKGESRYSLTTGIMRSSVRRPASFKYHADEPGLNAEYIYGLFHSLSTGFLWQVSQRNTMTGLQLLNANPLGYTEMFGLINADSASSQIGKRADFRHSVNINQPLKHLEFLELSLSGYLQNSTYNPYLFRPRSNASSNFAGVSCNIGTTFLQSHASAHVGTAFHRKSDVENFMDWLYGIMLSRNIYGLALSASASSSIGKNYTSYNFSLGAAYIFGIKRHRINLSSNLSGASSHTQTQYVENPYYNEELDFDYERDYEEPEFIEIPGNSNYNLRKRAALGWAWSGGGGNIGGQSYSGNISAQDNLDNVNAGLGARYIFNRAEIGVNSSFSNRESIYGSRQAYGLGARAGVSFMFADGLWAFGRPVQRGFILADVDGSLSGSTVRINYSEAYNTDLSRSGWLGAAYQNRIANYRPTSINIRLNNMPIGAWLEQNQYYVIGAYKQGYALRLGNDMRVFMQVRLIDEKGPLSNLYIAIFQMDSDSKIVSKRATFTSRDGTLQVGNLIPGEKYRISFDPSTYIKDIDIEIPKDSGSFIELPVIKIERE